MSDWMETEEVTKLLEQHIEDMDFVRELLKIKRWQLPRMEAVPEALRDVEEVVSWIVRNAWEPEKEFAYASERIKKDKNFIFQLMTGEKSVLAILGKCDASVRGDRDFVLSLLNSQHAQGRRYENLLPYVSESLQDDEEIVFRCCQIEMGAIRYASPRIKNNKRFVLSILNFPTMAGPIEFVLKGEPILQDPDFVRKAFEKTRHIDFENAPEEIKQDILLVLRALNGKCMPYNCCVDSMMGMFFVFSPFSGVQSLHISPEILHRPAFARLIADQYFASEMGKPHREKFPYDQITDIYRIMDEIAEASDAYWYEEEPDCRFDFTKEIEALSGQMQAELKKSDNK